MLLRTRHQQPTTTTTTTTTTTKWIQQPTSEDAKTSEGARERLNCFKFRDTDPKAKFRNNIYFDGGDGLSQYSNRDGDARSIDTLKQGETVEMERVLTSFTLALPFCIRARMRLT